MIYNTWGSSESGGALFINVSEIASDPLKVSSIGRPLQGIQVRVLDEQGEEMQQNDREHPGRMSLKCRWQGIGTGRN